MIRLHVLTEGQTELLAVERVLCPHLLGFRVYADARCILTREHETRYTPAGAVVKPVRRGGMRSYQQPRRDLERWMKEDAHPECYFTTMLDLYGLPKDFPGYAAAARCQDPYRRVAALENAMANDIDYYRFIPYIQLHEFEALLLAEPRQLDWEYIDHDPAIAALERLVSGCESPELIDDTPDGAPSKRIITAIPEYDGDKVRVGPEVMGRIGISTLRAKCPHFREWLTRLEALGETC